MLDAGCDIFRRSNFFQDKGLYLFRGKGPVSDGDWHTVCTKS
jgi:hypothetical protein